LFSAKLLGYATVPLYIEYSSQYILNQLSKYKYVNDVPGTEKKYKLTMNLAKISAGFGTSAVNKQHLQIL